MEAFEIDPRNLTLVTNKKATLYDPRVTLPVPKGPGTVYAMLRDFGWTHGAVELERVKDGNEEYLLVVDGKQRVKALLELNTEREKAGLPAVLARCFVSSGTPAGQFTRMWVANHGARPNTPLEDAAMIQGLLHLEMEAVPAEDTEGRIAARKRAEKHAAVILGCSVDTVRGRMQLNQASPAVKKALKDGTISASDALKIVGQGKTVRSNEEQEALLSKTPAKVPGKRRTQQKKGPGKRGGNSRPSVRALQKVLEVMGDGHDFYLPLAFALGLIPAEEFFKKANLPTPGKRVVAAKKGEG